MAIKIDSPIVKSARADAVSLKMSVFCRELSVPAVAPSVNGIMMPDLITATNSTTADAKEIQTALTTLKNAKIVARESGPSQLLPQKLRMFLIRNVKMIENGNESLNLNVGLMNENVNENVTATPLEEVYNYYQNLNLD
jgi:hypothetical protein